ncbi:hypothetical protein AUR64_13215 [Haloprofundus marisrubri]|uniref:Amidinotransferase n=1 Tax=Haloprofundus marisrubri TaxID=1514971 RepID=A0A0W1R5W4_9EURY|nr:arginine deiminase-related protein [Haloprofundus marisrubri]KTG08781.1 hypothetical protein AUR64_13215 [Haloprofundus marisrubri]
MAIDSRDVTQVGRVYDTARVLDFDLESIPSRQDHETVLLVSPQYFDVRYHINPYMGGEVDGTAATEQWETLQEAYEEYASRVLVFDPDEVWASLSTERKTLPPEGLPDMVFCANHGVATPDGDGVVLAAMSNAERVDEPTYFGAWCQENGYRTMSLAPGTRFEGGGDAIWHPGRELLWGGYGIRSDKRAYDEIADRLGVRVVTLELTDENYYHLDVCFAPLDEETVLIQSEAFTDEGLATIHALFETVIDAPVDESTGGLACNLHSVDGERVIMSRGNPKTAALLEAHGYETTAVCTDEFQKAGGSVRCLTLSLGDGSRPGYLNGR